MVLRLLLRRLGSSGALGEAFRFARFQEAKRDALPIPIVSASESTIQFLVTQFVTGRLEIRGNISTIATNRNRLLGAGRGVGKANIKYPI